MDVKFCHSCGIILDGKIGVEKSQNLCQYCTGEDGKLNAKETVQSGIAEWLKTFAPAGKEADFMKRAESYMNAMPAWSKD